MSVTSKSLILAMLRHSLMDSVGKPEKCFFLFIRSSSIAATTLLLTIIQAEESA